jgi:hypothetical protein
MFVVKDSTATAVSTGNTATMHYYDVRNGSSVSLYKEYGPATAIGFAFIGAHVVVVQSEDAETELLVYYIAA